MNGITKPKQESGEGSDVFREGSVANLVKRIKKYAWALEQRVTNLLLGKRELLPVRIHGHKFYCPPQERTFRAKVLFRERDPDLVKVIKDTVKPGDVVLDLGAHTGYFTLLMAKLVGSQGRVVAFEANPAVLPYLEKNIRVNGYEDRVTIVPKAVGGEEGSMNLYRVREGFGGVSLYEREGRHNQSETVPVEVITGDQALEDVGLNNRKISLAKIDVEGAEQEAISGLNKTIESNDQISLVVEFHPDLLKASGVTVKDFLEALKEKGLVNIFPLRDEGSWLEDPEIWLEEKNAKRQVEDLFVAKRRT